MAVPLSGSYFLLLRGNPHCKNYRSISSLKPDNVLYSGKRRTWARAVSWAPRMSVSAMMVIISVCSLLSLLMRAEAYWSRVAIWSSQRVWLKLASHFNGSWLLKAMRNRLPNAYLINGSPYNSIILVAKLLLEPMPLFFIYKVYRRELACLDLATHSS